MPVGQVPDLIGLLKETLERLEKIDGIQPDDPGLQELKRYVVLIIAELQLLKDDVAA